MPIYKQKGSPNWYYDFTLRGGDRVRRSTGTADRDQALLIEAKARHDAFVQSVTGGAKPELTLDPAFARYWIEHARDLPSAYDIQWRLQRLLKGLGDLMLSAITDGATANYVAVRRGEVSNASTNRELVLLRAVLRRARDAWGVAVSMPNWKSHLTREPAPRDRILTVEEAERLTGCAPPHLAPAIELSLLTGIRLGNMIGLDWSQVNLAGSEINIMVKSRTPGGKPLTVPLAQRAVIILANMRPRSTGPVFTYKGKAIKSWKKAWASTKSRACITDFRWHDLRHTSASMMVRAGVPIDVVRQVLGHEHIATTLRYITRDVSAKRTAVEAVAAELRHSDASAFDEAVATKRKNGGR